MKLFEMVPNSPLKLISKPKFAHICETMMMKSTYSFIYSQN